MKLDKHMEFLEKTANQYRVTMENSAYVDRPRLSDYLEILNTFARLKRIKDRRVIE